MEQLERQLQDKDSELRSMIARARSAEAELERAKARIERDAARQLRRRQSEFLAGFLDVLDDVDRAVAAAREHGAGDSLREGIELVQRRFVATLADQGVSRIDPAGEPFDPRFHDAVSIAPIAEADRDGVVLHVVAPGYATDDEVLRPARVVVGRTSRAHPQSA